MGLNFSRPENERKREDLTLTYNTIPFHNKTTWNSSHSYTEEEEGLPTTGKH
jgi:hypothetical protein